MRSLTKELLDFVMGTHFEDLSPEVVHESKRILLDSIGVAIAALKTEKGGYGIALAKRLGGSPEAAILGTGDRVSCGSAAFANGELINAMDYDGFTYPTHAPPSVVPAPLALGESIGATGKEMILAIALGCELSVRLGAAIRGFKKVFDTEVGSEVGKIVGTKNNISAVGVVTIAGTIGAGKVMKFDEQKMAHAMGLAAHFSPFPQAKWRTLNRMPMAKYVSSGWTSMAEVTAILLAEMGYTADTTFLDGDLGFWRFFGSDKWNPEALTERFGQEWKMLKHIQYKPYPCCGDFHVALDCIIKIIDENRLMPENIQKIKVQTHPAVTRPIHNTKEITDHVIAQFSMPYSIAAAVHRISLAEWQDPEKINDPNILKFMDKVFLETHPNFFEVQAKEPGSNMTTVEVMTKDKIFKKEGKFAKGFSHLEYSKMTDEDLVEKFKVNASKVLPKDKVEKAVGYLMELENIKDISEVVKEITSKYPKAVSLSERRGR
jgi:2-methylcitrate dehydratase PrpD